MHPNLLKLLVNNRGKGFFKAETSTGGEATIYIYDPIVSDQWEADYFGGVTPMMFIKELMAIDAETIHLRINSPGGDVFAARVMQQAMREHSAKFIAHIDGIAASAATFLPMAADESVISKGGMFMIHNAWTIALGDSKELRKTADLLDKIDGSIAADYADKTKKPLDEIRALMDKETYLLDQEAVDSGFIDAIVDSSPKAKIAWDLSAYDPNTAENWRNSLKIEQKLTEKPPKLDLKEVKNRPKFRELLTA